MNVKKIISMLIVALLILSAAAPATATEEETEPGLTPDSPFYFLKTWVEKIRLFFAFSPKGKVTLLTKFAETRLAEAQAMVKRGKPEIAEKCVDRYEKCLERAEEEIKKKDKVDKDVYETVAEATSKHTAVLQGLLEKVPEQAKDAIEHAIEVSQRGHDRALEALERKGPPEEKGKYQKKYQPKVRENYENRERTRDEEEESELRIREEYQNGEKPQSDKED